MEYGIHGQHSSQEHDKTASNDKMKLTMLST